MAMIKLLICIFVDVSLIFMPIFNRKINFQFLIIIALYTEQVNFKSSIRESIELTILIFFKLFHHRNVTFIYVSILLFVKTQRFFSFWIEIIIDDLIIMFFFRFLKKFHRFATSNLTDHLHLISLNFILRL